MLGSANVSDLQGDWYCDDFLGGELFHELVSINKGDSAPCVKTY